MAVGDISKRSWIKVIKDFELAERTSKTVEMATNERHRSWSIYVRLESQCGNLIANCVLEWIAPAEHDSNQVHQIRVLDAIWCAAITAQSPPRLGTYKFDNAIKWSELKTLATRVQEYSWDRRSRKYIWVASLVHPNVEESKKIQNQSWRLSFLAMGRTLIATLTRWNTNLKFGYLPGIQPLYESTPPIHDRLALNHWRQDRFTNTETRVFVYRLEDTVDPSCEWNDFQGERLKMYLMPFNEAFARCQNRLDRNLYTMAAQLLLTDPKWYFPKDHTIPGIRQQLGAVAWDTDGEGQRAYITRVYFEGRETGY
jgi:hypothetical protein